MFKRQTLDNHLKPPMTGNSSTHFIMLKTSAGLGPGEMSIDGKATWRIDESK